MNVAKDAKTPASAINGFIVCAFRKDISTKAAPKGHIPPEMLTLPIRNAAAKTPPSLNAPRMVTPS